MKILGLSAYYHDASAALINETRILAAAQEERFTRRKADASFPLHSLRFCLESQGLKMPDIDALVFYDKPWLTFERLLETSLATAPRGLMSFLSAMPLWLHHKLNLRATLRKELRKHFGAETPPIFFSSHHLSHAASAFYPSPFESAAVLCLDGVGEWATSSAWLGEQNRLTPLWEIHFPHSLGLLYSAFTFFCGFKVNSGEYKLMGLAPFGQPRFQNLIEENLIDVKEDGTFRLNMDFFSFASELRMTNQKFADLFGVPPRQAEGPMDAIYMDLAASVQAVTNEIMLRLARTLRQETGQKNLCLAGGVALNCVANGLIAREKVFDQVWIQPAAGDAGGALGAALAYRHVHLARPRAASLRDDMRGALLGPRFSDAEIQTCLESFDLRPSPLGETELLQRTAQALQEQQVVGWFQGAMEYGPRALGGRSILGDARNPQMKSAMNLKIKFREGFRPFAPIVLQEESKRFFDLEGESPYMLLTAASRHPRDMPAITHVDGSARVQTVTADRHGLLHRLLKEFHHRTGCPVLINTSFNVRGEPIVGSPRDAVLCFLNTDMDALALGNFFLTKSDVAHLTKDARWSERFERD